MPEIIENYDWKTRPLTTTGYPWDTWTDGRTYRFVQGIDFHIAPVDFARQARRAANKRGLQAHTRRTAETVTIRFTPREATTT